MVQLSAEAIDISQGDDEVDVDEGEEEIVDEDVEYVEERSKDIDDFKDVVLYS